MGRSSIRYIESTYIYTKNSMQTAPVTSPVIYAPFPKYSHKKSACEKINKFLNIVLLCFVVLSLVSYYLVSEREKTMNILGREIVALANENIELQNKLDNLNSFKKIDSVIYNNTSLDTARKVMEIPAVAMNSDVKLQDIPVNYNWSMGY